MRQSFDRLMVAMGLALLVLALLVSTTTLSKASAVANQLGIAASIMVIGVGMLDQWWLRRRQQRNKHF
jgi:ABC-type nickel/cobalt efflux system permease component RcnA